MAILATKIWQYWQQKYGNIGNKNMAILATKHWQYWQQKMVYDNHIYRFFLRFLWYLFLDFLPPERDLNVTERPLPNFL